MHYAYFLPQLFAQILSRCLSTELRQSGVISSDTNSLTICKKKQVNYLALDWKNFSPRHEAEQFSGKDQVEASIFRKLFDIHFFTRDTGVIVDVGANDGQIFSDGHSAAKLCGYCDYVHSEAGWLNGFKNVDSARFSWVSFYLFEPNLLSPHGKLTRAVEGARNRGYVVEVSNAAISNKIGKSYFAFPKISRADEINQHGHLHPNVIEGRRKSNISDFDFMEVNVTTLDELFFKEQLHLDLVKIDTEGYDLNVIYGMKNLLKRELVDVIIHECHALMERYQLKRYFYVLIGIIFQFTLIELAILYVTPKSSSTGCGTKISWSVTLI